MSNFRVGQRVVCVKEGKWYPWLPGETHPVKGQVLTIRDLLLRDSGLHLRFVELRNPFIRADGEECAYLAKRFRPVKTTSIAIFRAMLVQPPKVRTPA